MINRDTTLCISIAARPGNFGAEFHNSGYRKLGLNWIYLPRKVVTIGELEGVLSGVRSLDIRGCSVSMPHKEAVIPYLDQLDEAAEKIGAVNTIKPDEEGRLIGFNTDYFGAKKALEKVELKDGKALMIGAGGVARAVGLAVKDLGGRLTITNRNFDKAEKLGDVLNAKVIEWSAVTRESGHVLINATSVGMDNPDIMIVSGEVIENFDAVMDVVIYPPRTKLLDTVKKMAKPVIAGTSMCVYQAAEQFEIYTGCSAPQGLISETLEKLEK